MPIAEQYARVLQILGAQEELGESRRKRQAEQSIGEIFARSGGNIDMGTIQQAFQADPGTAMQLLEFATKQQTSQARLGTEQLRQQNLQGQIGQRGNDQLARYAYQYVDGFDKLPPEKKTIEMWRKGYLPARQKAIQMGLATEDMLPEGAGPDDLRSIIGLGFPVAQQAQIGLREQEAATKQQQFNQTYDQRQALSDQRLGQQASIAAQNRAQQLQISNANREASNARGGTEISYDEQGRPVIRMGGSKPLTEAQGKATALGLRGGEATQQLKDIEDSGYRPTTATQLKQFAGEVMGSKNRYLDPEGQKYEQALLNFGTAIGRFESGAAIPETEWQRFVEQYGARPGSSDEELAQKQQNRETAIIGMDIAAGPGGNTRKKQAGSVQNRTRQQIKAAPASAGDIEQRKAEISRFLSQ